MYCTIGMGACTSMVENYMYIRIGCVFKIAYDEDMYLFLLDTFYWLNNRIYYLQYNRNISDCHAPKLYLFKKTELWEYKIQRSFSLWFGQSVNYNLQNNTALLHFPTQLRLHFASEIHALFCTNLYLTDIFCTLFM